MMMTKEKKALLDTTFQTFMEVGFGQGHPDQLDDIVAKDVVGIGTAIDEKLFGIQQLKDLVIRQSEQSAGMEMSWKINTLDLHITPDENTAIYTNDLNLYLTVEGDTIEMYLRFSVVLEYGQNKWMVVHWHGSKPEHVESEKDTWGIQSWKEKAEALEKEVAERTADLVEKNRELKIEAALEKVRARSLVMQKSDELNEVMAILFEKLKELQIPFTAVGIAVQIVGSKDFDAFVCGENEAGLVLTHYRLPYFDHIIPNDIHQTFENQLPYFVGQYSKEEKDSFYVNVMEHSAEFRYLNEDVKRRIFESPSYTISMIAVKHAVFNINDFEGKVLAEDKVDILQRFARVFDQGYTRFLDLQKAESQARESQLELSLERIRSQVTAMRESTDLLDIVVTLRSEFVALGLEAHYFWHMRWLPDKYEKAMTSGDGTRIGMVMTLPRHIHGDIPSVADWEMSHEATYILAMDADTAVEYVHKMITLGDFEQVDPQAPTLDDIRHIGGLTFVMARTTHGEIGFSLPGVVPHPSENSVETLVRFAGVFDLAYKRFEDLQAAEHQHREAKIELAMEKVRSRTMGMQHSSELNEISKSFHEQLLLLGIDSEFSFVWLPDEVKNEHLFWATWVSEENGVPQFQSRAIHYPLDKTEPGTAACYVAWESGHPVHETFVPPDEIVAFFAIWEELLRGAEKLKPELFPEGIYYTEAYMKYGCFGIDIRRPLDNDEKEIIRRFAVEFERTYTRFLDLQKAEVQAREARIEAVLEKVRARALAMQKPDELKEVAQLLREEMGALGVEELETSSIYIHDESSGTTQCWFAIKNTDDPGRAVTDQMTLDLHATWVGRKMMEFYRSSAKHTSILMQGKNRIEWICYCEEKSILFSSRGFYGETIPERTYHLYKFSNGFLGAASPGDISHESWDLLKRATNVFSFAYTRFHDLQVAEASTWVALQQASLDRVRADIASMRSTEDLQRITPLIWQELTHLQVSFIRCGVFIMDEDAQIVHTYLSTADGKDIAAIHLPYRGMSITEQAVDHWRKQAVYVDHWDKAGFHQWTKHLIDQGYIASPENYQAGAPPDSLHLHFVPFTQGMLYVGSADPLPEESIDLIHSLAGAFATAYARYEDFSKLEVAKQKTDVALAELEAAKDQLVQQEKLASLGQLTAGIAHEIKNPLNFVNNFSEVNLELLEEVRAEIVRVKTQDIASQPQDIASQPQDIASQREDAKTLETITDILDNIQANLRKIHEHGARADSIVKSMLMHSRGGSGQKEPTDLNELLKEYVNLTFHGMRAGKHPINMQIDLQLDETLNPIPVIVEDISRVFINLCNNAFDAMRSKLSDPALQNGYTPKLTVRTKAGSPYAFIEIEDNGPGVPEEIREKILQPFFTTKKGTQGTGLGLSISHDIVKAHGGDLRMESTLDKGVKFVILLPTSTST